MSIQVIYNLYLYSKRLSDKFSPLSNDEKSALRGALGQLNWLSGMSRPEISFMVSDLSSKVNKAVINDILEVNKVIMFVQNSPGYITIPHLDLKSVQVTVFSDASFNNVEHGNSQGGHIVLLSDRNAKCAPITWTSNRLKRVARSTLAAETLSFTDAADTGFFVSKLLQNITNISLDETPIITCITDSKSLFEMLGTSHQISDRRLRVEVSAIRQMVDCNEISVQWTNKEKQLSDVLTKKGASQSLMMNTLQSGILQK